MRRKLIRLLLLNWSIITLGVQLFSMSPCKLEKNLIRERPDLTMRIENTVYGLFTTIKNNPKVKITAGKVNNLIRPPRIELINPKRSATQR